MKISVICGGNSSERDVSLKTGESVYKALSSVNEYDVSLIKFKEYNELLNNKDFLDCDKVFIALHGEGGEDGRLQGMLDLLHKKYTGSSYYASAIAMDKDLSKHIAKLSKVDTPNWINIDSTNYKDVKSLNFPVVVKPAKEGSSVGLFIFDDYDTYINQIETILSDFSDLMAEEFIAGRELTVAILNNKPLEIVEISPKKGVYDFESKYTKGMTEYYCPAKLDEVLANKIKESALEIGVAIGCSGLYRVDFRLDAQNRFYFLEVNTIPGMTETSLAPMSANACGIDFVNLCKKIVEED